MTEIGDQHNFSPKHNRPTNKYSVLTNWSMGNHLRALFLWLGRKWTSWRKIWVKIFIFFPKYQSLRDYIYINIWFIAKNVPKQSLMCPISETINILQNAVHHFLMGNKILRTPWTILLTQIGNQHNFWTKHHRTTNEDFISTKWSMGNHLK